MADNTYTRCPGCATVFRVTAAQRALREGQVRCGHCRAVFDANEQVIALDASSVDDPGVHDELAAGKPTVTLRSADALQPVDLASATVDAPAPVDAPERPVDGADAESAVAPEAIAAVPANEPSALIDIGALDRSGRFEWKPRKPLRERPMALFSMAIALLLATLALQAVGEYRDPLAAHVPPLRPLLQTICDLAGCTVAPMRDAAALSIDASDLQADPVHRGLLILKATIRNRAAYEIAYPYLELTLTDASDRVVARRAFPPGDYAGETANPDAGIPGNGEKVVTLIVDASTTSQAGYRLYLFYP